jgi:hypothetical protein
MNFMQMGCARVDYVAEGKPKGPASGFWEHNGVLYFYFVFKMQVSFHNHHSNKRNALCVV